MDNLLENEISRYRQEIKSERMDMSFGEIINMYKDREIIISPEYQRAFRWDIQRQSDFIESILLGIPFPSIFVATNPDGKWELIDGLQRVSTVLSFFNELKDENGNDYPKNGLTLVKGNLINSLEGVTIDTLPLEFKLQIKRTPCRVEIILKESDFKMRYELFKRLNTGGEGLSRQEIRNCIFRGLDNSYNSFIRGLASFEGFKNLIYLSKSNEEKMYYDELVLRFLTLKNMGTRYKQSNIQDYMDDYMRKQSENPDIENMHKDEDLFKKIIGFLESVDNKDMFKLGTQSFATSMFDSIMLSLSYSEDITKLDSKKFGEKIDQLKETEDFKKYTGSASSNPTSITNKVETAKKILIDFQEETHKE